MTNFKIRFCHSCTWRQMCRPAISTWATVWPARWSAVAKKRIPSRWRILQSSDAETTRRPMRIQTLPSARPRLHYPSAGTANIIRKNLSSRWDHPHQLEKCIPTDQQRSASRKIWRFPICRKPNFILILWSIFISSYIL